MVNKMFKINDYVSRISYNHDIIFQIIEINENEAKLEGFEKRLIATAPLSDLSLVGHEIVLLQEKNSFEKMSSIK